MRLRFIVSLVTALFCCTGCDLSMLTGNDDKKPTDASPVSAAYIVVTTSDYSNGNMALIAVDDFTSRDDLLSIFSDNAVFCHDGSIFVLERDGADNIIRIDGADVSADNVAYQEEIGTSVNLQQIAVISDSKAYVTQYGDNTIAIINPSNGNVTGSISLEGKPFIHDGEEAPFMSAAVIVGDKAYVALQRLKTVQSEWGPYPDVGDSTGMIVVIDTDSDEIVKKIKLKRGNPCSIDTCGGNLYVSSTGSWSDPADGGIEKIDCSTDRNEGVVVEEETFGGDISTLVMISETQAYVAVGMYDADFNFSTVVKECNPSTGTVGETVESVEDAFGGMAYDGTHLYIGDRSPTDPGVVVIDPSDNSKVAGPIDVGSLPPSALAVLKVSE
ncbi:MAG: hypothetical protein JW863_22325 [Chitinispirillaceae bacterium]|nr:hypothetical protein [Chitinispirillaceae bacterium]